MLATLVITALVQVQIPGAASMTPIINERLAAGLLSDDGTTGYYFDSGINRYPLMARGGPSGGELLISRRENGMPHTRTTSQDAHFEYRPGTISLLRVGTTRTLCSPGDETVLSTTLLQDGSLRLSVVRLAARGEFPNNDYELLDVAEDNAMGVAARWLDGKPVWYVRKWRRSQTGRIERCDIVGNRLTSTLVGSTPAGMRPQLHFDPDSGIVISEVDGHGVFHKARVGSSSYSLVDVPEGVTRTFLWRGGVYASDRQRTYKLTEANSWDVFCNYRHLASSANGAFWAVRDSVGQPFLVRFD